MINEAQFWQCISILLRNYHATNKQICACLIERVQKVTKALSKTPQTVSDAEAETEVNSNEEELQSDLENPNESKVEGYLVHCKFLTKKLELENLNALCIVDFRNTSYTCQFINSHLDDFSVKYRNAQIEVEILTHKERKHQEQDTQRKALIWAEHVLKPKLLKWSLQPPIKYRDANVASDADHQPAPKSLQLVDIEAYTSLYKQLKQKYAQQVLALWKAAKESTDPLKFIYEDLAIAAYLITLWSRYGAPTAFADLGCGNGLLVYILHMEDYLGYGYDIRARKLWPLYPAATRQLLIEQAIEPEHFKLPAEVDWLIGNHSDELSPWLPVLAATAHCHMRYFLLPCCAYEFSGAKYQRRNTRTSTYQDFYAYAASISEECGYRTLRDRLKIPSTKRLALIGMERTHAAEEYELQLRRIADFVAAERRKNRTPATADVVLNGEANGVKLRVKQEVVRNCTQIDKSVLAMLVEKIFCTLLEAGAPAAAEAKRNAWYAGGQLSMRELAMRLTASDLRHIKSECGGIKTLLRNRHEIFEFRGNELIGIRKPKVMLRGSASKSSNKLQTIRKRVCFFKQHHPNGCPLTDEQCTFIH